LCLLCNKHRNPATSAFLIFRVRRKRRYSKLPEPRPFTLVLDLTHPHQAHDRLIANFHIWIDAQIVHPDWIVWSAADRSYQDVIIAILYSHQWCLSDGTGVRWGLENLNLSDARLKELGFEGMLKPIKISCSDHEGAREGRVQQWDGKGWKIISDWYTANQSITEPLVDDVSARYAAEKKIQPRDCSKES